MTFIEDKSFQFSLSSYFAIKADKDATVSITREIAAIYICHTIIGQEQRSSSSAIIVISENQILYMQ